MYHISLFSGIGGFDLAATWAGWENIVSCEINPVCQRLLQYYWPESYHHDNIHTLNYKKINEELTKKKGRNWRTKKIIISGGFPCQPYSTSGKRKGNEDPRHLWPEMLRTIKEIQPDWVVGENVFGLVNWNGGMVFNEVQIELENQGYQVQPYLLPACGKDAPHKRYRIFIVAYRDNSTTKYKIPTGRKELATLSNKQKESGAETIFSTKNGSIRPNGLMDFLMFYDIVPMPFLPTPTAQEGEKITGKENQNSLTKMARETTGKTGQLNPRFVAELMGFPTNWTELPFQNGETKV